MSSNHYKRSDDTGDPLNRRATKNEGSIQEDAPETCKCSREDCQIVLWCSACGACHSYCCCICTGFPQQCNFSISCQSCFQCSNHCKCSDMTPKDWQIFEADGQRLSRKGDRILSVVSHEYTMFGMCHLEGKDRKRITRIMSRMGLLKGHSDDLLGKMIGYESEFITQMLAIWNCDESVMIRLMACVRTNRVMKVMIELIKKRKREETSLILLKGEKFDGVLRRDRTPYRGKLLNNFYIVKSGERCVNEAVETGFHYHVSPKEMNILAHILNKKKLSSGRTCFEIET